MILGNLRLFGAKEDKWLLLILHPILFLLEEVSNVFPFQHSQASLGRVSHSPFTISLSTWYTSLLFVYDF